MQWSNKLRQLNVFLTDLAVTGNNNLRLKLPNIQSANSFIKNKALLNLLDISVRILQSLIYKHGLVYGVELGISDEDILPGIDPTEKVVKATRLTKAIKELDSTFIRVPTKLGHLIFQRNFLPKSLIVHFTHLTVTLKVRTVVQCKKNVSNIRELNYAEIKRYMFRVWGP